MIVNLNGKLIEKNPCEAIIDVNGVGYLCYISNNTYDSLPSINKNVSLLIYHQIKVPIIVIIILVALNIHMYN